jgi:hypothetical protein
VLRFSKVSLAAVALLLFACSSPAPAELSLSLVSDRGLIDADVRIGSPVRRGDNELLVDLRPHAGDGMPSLVAVTATMAAHGHTARAASVELTRDGYRATELDLFMSGRWQLELELTLDDQLDAASLPVDVP